MSLKIETDFPYVIRLYRDAKCETMFLGSGLLIGRRHVLTCAHVADKRNPRKKWYAKDCNKRIAGVTHLVSLNKPNDQNNVIDDVDLALLELTLELGDDSVGPATILHGSTNFQSDIDLRAVGGIDLNSIKTDRILSTVYNSEGIPLDRQVSGGFWEGYSGCPVIMPYGEKWVCIGIAWMGRKEAATSRILTGDTVYRFLQERRKDLLDAGGIQFLDPANVELHEDKIEETQAKLTKAAVHELYKSKKALDVLADQLAVGPLQDEKRSAEVINKLLETPSSTLEMLKKLVEVMTDLDDKKLKEAADTVQTLAYYLIPASLNRAHVQRLTVITTAGVESFEFQANTKTFVEFAMARINGRPLQLRTQDPKTPTRTPSGELCLEDPPETGMDDKHDLYIQSFVSDLCTKLVNPDFIIADQAKNVESINVALDYEFEAHGWQYYYVFSYPENEAGRKHRNEVARELDRMFPRIAFVGLERGKGTTDEQKILLQMKAILYRAADLEMKPAGKN